MSASPGRFCGKWILILALALVLGPGPGCKQEEKNYSSQEIWAMAQEVDPEIKLIIPDKDHPPIDLLPYGPKVMYGLIAETKKLQFYMIRFESYAAALEAANRLNAYYYYNWIFDEVSGEPILEDFVKKVYKAQLGKEG